MKKIILVILLGLMFSLTACGGGGSNDSGSISSSTAKTIIGDWSYIYPSSGCEETYRFSDNRREGAIYVGQWAEKALDERMSGHYNIQPTGSNSYVLFLGVRSDNGLADCEGESSFETGSTFYVNVVFKNNNNSMEWSSLSGESNITLKRK